MSKKGVIQYEIRKIVRTQAMQKPAVIRILEFIIRVKSFQGIILGRGVADALQKKILFKEICRRLY